jgi:hypothetical protein
VPRIHNFFVQDAQNVPVAYCFREYYMRLTHAVMFDRVFRRTIGRVGYFLKPSDPRVVLEQWKSIQMATAFVQREAVARGLGVEQPTVEQVEAHVQQRIRVCPAADLWHHSMVDINIVFAINDTASDGEFGNEAAYLRLLRAANIIYATSNATGYVPLIASEILWSIMRSPGEAEFYRRKIFTKSSRFGTRMFSDLFIEMTVKYIRGQLGHRVTGSLEGHAEKVKSVVAFLKEKIEADRPRAELRRDGGASSGPLSTFEEPEKMTALGKEFWLLVDAIRYSNVWGWGDEPIIPLPKVGHVWPVNKPAAIPCSACVDVAGVPLDPACLAQVTLGIGRLEPFYRLIVQQVCACECVAPCLL